VLVRELQSIGLDVSVAKRTREGGELEVDLMTEVEESRPRGLRRPSPFSEIGIESELAELGRQPVVPSAAVAVSEPDEIFGRIAAGRLAGGGLIGGADDVEGLTEVATEDALPFVSEEDDAEEDGADDI
jgi:hypothetical protein